MNKFMYIVQVHPIYSGILQTHKVGAEHEFETKEQAEHFINMFNQPEIRGRKEFAKAVYVGCVDTTTGHLVE